MVDAKGEVKVSEVFGTFIQYPHHLLGWHRKCQVEKGCKKQIGSLRCSVLALGPV